LEESLRKNAIDISEDQNYDGGTNIILGFIGTCHRDVILQC